MSACQSTSTKIYYRHILFWCVLHPDVIAITRRTPWSPILEQLRLVSVISNARLTIMVTAMPMLQQPAYSPSFVDKYSFAIHNVGYELSRHHTDIITPL